MYHKRTSYVHEQFGHVHVTHTRFVNVTTEQFVVSPENLILEPPIPELMRSIAPQKSPVEFSDIIVGLSESFTVLRCRCVVWGITPLTCPLPLVLKIDRITFFGKVQLNVYFCLGESFWIVWRSN